MRPNIFDAKVQSNVDANNIITTGVYLLTDNITNAYTWGYLICLAVSNTYIIQINYSLDGSGLRARTKNDQNWNSWR